MSATLHIGHHFFGSGNIGDDYMLAGFLALAAETMPGARLTCCTPFDRASQQHRLPGVTWLDYTDAARDEAIAACDAWIGVGDSPFQSEVGSWFLDHLLAERDRCRRFGKPMYFFCVGVNDFGAMENPATRAIVESAARIWTRDAQSARLLTAIVGPDRVSIGPRSGERVLRPSGIRRRRAGDHRLRLELRGSLGLFGRGAGRGDRPADQSRRQGAMVRAGSPHPLGIGVGTSRESSSLVSRTARRARA